MSIRGVLFDVGETLLGPAGSFGELYAEVLSTAGIEADAERCEQSLRATSQWMEQQFPTGSNRYQAFPGGETAYWKTFASRAIQQATGLELDETKSLSLLQSLRQKFQQREAWHLYDDVHPTLKQLSQHQLKLAVVSNWDSKLESVLELHELHHYFEVIVVSANVNVEKPDPAIFHHALSKLELEPQEVIHIGDRIDMDIQGAEAAGIQGLWIDRKQRSAPPTEQITRITSLIQVLDYI